MTTDAAPWHNAWQQTWRLGAAAVLGIPFWLATVALLPQDAAAGSASWFVTGDPAIALGCLVLLLWRARFPFTVAMLVATASAASTLAAGAAMLALCSLATRRRPAETGLVVLIFVAASRLALEFLPIQDGPALRAPIWLELTVPALTAGTTVAIGAAIGARRAEVRSLRSRAESAEREQAARAAQARTLERNRIAREMHDVLAHRISLVAMQAGVLDHRADLPAEESRVLIRGIAEGSHQALEELRDVLGVLRADTSRAEPGESTAPEAPQPSLDRLPELVADARCSGLDVTLTSTVEQAPPDALGRTCYRVVQEGLTNAAKHAAGAAVRVTVEGAAGSELRIGVRNTRGTAVIMRPPTSGFGLLGLTERVALAGGRLDHHPTPDNGYVLCAQLPWPRHDNDQGA